jgi:hypothetical protein
VRGGGEDKRAKCATGSYRGLVGSYGGLTGSGIRYGRVVSLRVVREARDVVRARPASRAGHAPSPLSPSGPPGAGDVSACPPRRDVARETEERGHGWVSPNEHDRRRTHAHRCKASSAHSSMAARYACTAGGSQGRSWGKGVGVGVVGVMGKHKSQPSWARPSTVLCRARFARSTSHMLRCSRSRMYCVA